MSDEQTVQPQTIISTLDGNAWFTVILPIFAILIGITCILLNSVVVMFFRTRAGNINTLICFVLSISDFAAGCGSLLQGVFILIFYAYPETGIYTFPTFYLVCHISMRTSAAYNVFLTIARTWTLLYPIPGGDKRRRQFFQAAIILVLLLWVNIVGFEVFSLITMGKTGHEDLIKNFIVFPRAGGIILFKLCHGNWSCIERYHDVWFQGVVFVVPFLLPSMICFISAIFQIYRTVTRRKNRTERSGSSYEKTMRTTIIALTVAFFICNTFYITLLYILYTKMTNVTILLLFTITSNHIVHFNSFITPAIQIFRSKQINQYATQKLHQVTGGFRTSVHKMMVSVNTEPRTGNSFV